MSAKLKQQPEPDQKFIGLEMMDWKKFDLLLDNPMQRNTELHAKQNNDLLHWDEVQADVQACVLPDGTRMKLNGHSRCFVWRNGMAPPPPMPLRVMWYRVADLEAAGLEKMKYDARRAVNQAGGELFGVMRFLAEQHGLHFTSQVLADCKFLGALKAAEGFMNPGDDIANLLDLTRRWLPELRLFDKVQATHARFTQAFVAGSLLLLRRYGDAVLPFLQAYQGKIGHQDGDMVHAQQVFNMRATLLKENAARKFSAARNGEVAQLMVSAYNAVEQDRWYPVGSGQRTLRMLNAKQFHAWLEEAREVARRR